MSFSNVWFLFIARATLDLRPKVLYALELKASYLSRTCRVLVMVPFDFSKSSLIPMPCELRFTFSPIDYKLWSVSKIWHADCITYASFGTFQALPHHTTNSTSFIECPRNIQCIYYIIFVLIRIRIWWGISIWPRGRSWTRLCTRRGWTWRIWVRLWRRQVWSTSLPHYLLRRSAEPLTQLVRQCTQTDTGPVVNGKAGVLWVSLGEHASEWFSHVWIHHSFLEFL